MIRLLNALTLRVDRMKTALWYRSQFRSIGKGSVLRKPMLLINPQFIALGDDVFIREGARLEALQTNPARTPSLTIGDHTNIEQNVHIICHSKVQIGANVSITGHCSIVDVTHPYADVEDPRKIGARILEEDSYVMIGDGCFLGIGTVILPNVTLGKYCVIGANSVVTSDIPDYSVAAGAPAKVLRTYDSTQKKWLRAAG